MSTVTNQNTFCTTLANKAWYQYQPTLYIYIHTRYLIYTPRYDVISPNDLVMKFCRGVYDTMGYRIVLYRY